MWNPAAVAATLKLHFAAKAGYRVVTRDVSNLPPRELGKLAELYAEARVVVTGVGLYNVYHVLLPPDAAVVDVETTGVSWEDLEL